MDGQGGASAVALSPPTLDTRRTDTPHGSRQGHGRAPCPINWTSGAVGQSDSLFPPPPRGRVQDFLDQARSWKTSTTLSYSVAPKWSISMPLRAISRSVCLANRLCALDCDLTPFLSCRVPSSIPSPFATHSPLLLPHTPPPTTSTGPTNRLQWHQALPYGQPPAAHQSLGKPATPPRSRPPSGRPKVEATFCTHRPSACT